MGVPEEIGLTARLAIASWSGTFRLCILLLVTAMIAVFLAVHRVPLIMW